MHDKKRPCQQGQDRDRVDSLYFSTLAIIIGIASILTSLIRIALLTR